MPLESGTFLNELVISNPVGASDNIDKGDDHIRLVKTLLKNSFPDVDQAVSTIISNPVAPPLARKGTIWPDETADLIKFRDKTDSAWITLAIDMLVSNQIDANSGEIDGTPIGVNAQAAGNFSSIGETVRGTGKFTDLDISGGFTGYANIEQGTSMCFFQAAAPTGWTQNTTHNDKALRVVSGAGGGNGGSVAFETAFASKAVTGTNVGTGLSIAQMPAHSHTYGHNNSAPRSGGGVNGGSFISTLATSTVGSGATHTHTFNGTAINLDVQFIDVIVASLD